MKGYRKNTSDLSHDRRQIDEALIADIKAYIAEHAEKPDTHTFLTEISALAGVSASFSLLVGKHFSKESSDLGEIKAFVDNTRNKDTFSVFLDKLRDEKGLSASELYNQAGIDRRHWQKITGNREYRPTKETVIKFGLALELSVKNMDALLETAGFVLSASSRFDLVIRYCLEHEIYNRLVVDQCLDAVCEQVLYSA
jgi:hypothetical protein